MIPPPAPFTHTFILKFSEDTVLLSLLGPAGDPSINQCCTYRLVEWSEKNSQSSGELMSSTSDRPKNTDRTSVFIQICGDLCGHCFDKWTKFVSSSNKIFYVFPVYHPKCYAVWNQCIVQLSFSAF